MPSNDCARLRYDLLNRPGLTPHQVKEIEHRVKSIEDREAASAIQWTAEERRRVAEQAREHEAKGREKSENHLARLKALRAGHMSAKEGLDLIAELHQFRVYIEGDGDRWVGIANTYEANLANLDQIAEDPGAYMDRLYAKYPALADGRFHDGEALMAEMAQQRRQQIGLFPIEGVGPDFAVVGASVRG